MTYWKFNLFATMSYSFAEAAKQQGATGGAEMDEIKRMLVETNPYYLGLTALVSILHVVCASKLVPLSGCTHRPALDLSSWHLAPMSLIGGRRRNLPVFPSGELNVWYDECSIH